MTSWLLFALMVVGLIYIAAWVISKMLKVGRAASTVIARNDPKSPHYRP